MACCSHRSRNAKALRRSQANSLVGSAYSFITTAITPVNIAYANELTDFCSAGGLQTLPDCRSFGRKPTR